VSQERSDSAITGVPLTIGMRLGRPPDRLKAYPNNPMRPYMMKAKAICSMAM